MKSYEPCDACTFGRAKVWWISSPASGKDYGWSELALCAHCTNLHGEALAALDWSIAVDERGKDAYRRHAKKVLVHVS